MTLRRVVFPDHSQVIFEAPAGATTCSQVQRVGLPRFVRPAGKSWRPWNAASFAVSGARNFDVVPLADPDPIAGAAPGAFVVDAVVWCRWPIAARVALRCIATWTRGPGVMRTEELDAPEAERVRSVCAQHALCGLEDPAVNGAAVARVESP